MDPDFAQRRRVAIAAAITVIAVPSVVLLNRGTESTDAAATGQTLVGTAPPVIEERPATAPAVTDAMGTTAIDAEARLDEPIIDEPARIAIPRLPQAIDGSATFRSDIITTTVCQVKGVPFNTQVTITNLDNSRSVQCFAAVGGPEPDDDVVMHPEAFLQIADITDAPVPVRITW